MSRESRHLKVSGFADTCSEEAILDHFNNYGRVQRVELLKDGGDSSTTATTTKSAAIVSFMDLRTAANAMNAKVHEVKGQQVKVTYFEPSSSTASLAATTNAATPCGQQAGDCSSAKDQKTKRTRQG